jgi:hypothetical protein
MSWCDNHKCPRPDDWIGTPLHIFSGYKYYLTFHKECCPKEFWGDTCREKHEN